jgi:FkbM family methyltransferase
MPSEPIISGAGLTFIQAGANDGITNDWLHAAIVAEGWRGVCVEPQPAVFARLRATYADRPAVCPIEGAIAAESGTRPFFALCHPDPALQAACDHLASFDRAVLHANAAIELAKLPHVRDRALDAWIVESTVRCYTVAELAAAHALRPDVLALDVEGAEHEILLGLDLDAIRPAHIFYEAFHLAPAARAACAARLRDAGYELRPVAEYGIDDFNTLATLASAPAVPSVHGADR